MSKQKFEQSLHTQRAETEAHIKALQKENRAGVRYTAVIADVPFLVWGMLCDGAWIAYLIFEMLYLKKDGFQREQLPALDILSVIAAAVLIFGIAVTIYLGRIHEKEIATRLQKNLSFGAIVWGGFAAGVLGMVQLLCAAASPYLMGVVISGFATFAFGMPIFASFQKGIFYSEAGSAEERQIMERRG